MIDPELGTAGEARGGGGDPPSAPPVENPLHHPADGPPPRAGEDLYATVIGDPIVQSKSPLIHRFWLERLALPGDYRREQVAAADLATYLATQRQEPNWRGCNVTIPHKQAVIPYLDRLDPLAEKIGAVNTIVAENGRLIGHNTDAPGFLEPLSPLLAKRHLLRTARIVGAGGASRAIAHALWDEGFTLIVYTRNAEQAAQLLAPFGDKDTHIAPLDTLATPLDFEWGETGDDRLDLFVNASPLGMAGQPPLDLHVSHLPPGAVVYDAVYHPLETPLLVAARAAGHPVIDGLSMLIGQARIAFRHFFGVEPPADADTELRALLTA